MAGRELAEHAQLFAEFIEQQRRNRSKVIDCAALQWSLMVYVQFILHLRLLLVLSFASSYMDD